MNKKKEQKNSTSFKKKKYYREGARSRRKHRYRKNNEGKGSVEKKYFHLLEQYWAARRKYFESFHRTQGRKLERLKNNFYRTLAELRQLEKNLKTENKGEDLTYSRNHQLEPHPIKEELKMTEESEEFYILESQKKNTYGDDMEESVGTMEDYLAYKGSA